jgi:hypothetical protein
MQPQAEIERFAADWVAHNLRVVRSPSTNMAWEVDRLAAELTGAARANGISGGELNRVLGDIDDYLTEHYRQAVETV